MSARRLTPSLLGRLGRLCALGVALSATTVRADASTTPAALAQPLSLASIADHADMPPISLAQARRYLQLLPATIDERAVKSAELTSSRLADNRDPLKRWLNVLWYFEALGIQQRRALAPFEQGLLSGPEVRLEAMASALQSVQILNREGITAAFGTGDSAIARSSALWINRVWLVGTDDVPPFGLIGMVGALVHESRHAIGAGAPHVQCRRRGGLIKGGPQPFCDESIADRGSYAWEMEFYGRVIASRDLHATLRSHAVVYALQILDDNYFNQPPIGRHEALLVATRDGRLGVLEVNGASALSSLETSLGEAKLGEMTWLRSKLEEGERLLDRRGPFVGILPARDADANQSASGIDLYLDQRLRGPALRPVAIQYEGRFVGLGFDVYWSVKTRQALRDVRMVADRGTMLAVFSDWITLASARMSAGAPLPVLEAALPPGVALETLEFVHPATGKPGIWAGLSDGRWREIRVLSPNQMVWGREEAAVARAQCKRESSGERTESLVRWVSVGDAQFALTDRGRMVRVTYFQDASGDSSGGRATLKCVEVGAGEAASDSASDRVQMIGVSYYPAFREALVDALNDAGNREE